MSVEQVMVFIVSMLIMAIVSFICGQKSCENNKFPEVPEAPDPPPKPEGQSRNVSQTRSIDITRDECDKMLEKLNIKLKNDDQRLLINEVLQIMKDKCVRELEFDDKRLYLRDDEIKYSMDTLRGAIGLNEDQQKLAQDVFNAMKVKTLSSVVDAHKE